MGYLLPIRPVQSEQYAMRLNMEPYNFANVGKLQELKLKSDFLEEFKKKLYSLDEKEQQEDNEQPHKAPLSQLNRGLVSPNPASLSPSISHIVGKGISVNTYI